MSKDSKNVIDIISNIYQYDDEAKERAIKYWDSMLDKFAVIESNDGKNKINLQGSSAKGTYQFLTHAVPEGSPCFKENQHLTYTEEGFKKRNAILKMYGSLIKGNEASETFKKAFNLKEKDFDKYCGKNSFQVGLTRLEEMVKDNIDLWGGEIPEWITKAQEDNNILVLEKDQERALTLANLYRQPHTDSHLQSAAKGDKKAYLNLYCDHHHTKCDEDTYNRAKSYLFPGEYSLSPPMASSLLAPGLLTSLVPNETQ